MKYYYEYTKGQTRVFGKTIQIDHPIYQAGTLYFENGLGIIVVQKKFDAERKLCYWSYLDPAIANDIYLSPNFLNFFTSNATDRNFPIFQLRKLMWELRMKPLRKEEWEVCFS